MFPHVCTGPRDAHAYAQVVAAAGIRTVVHEAGAGLHNFLQFPDFGIELTSLSMEPKGWNRTECQASPETVGEQQS